jgi:hypothetical protein
LGKRIIPLWRVLQVLGLFAFYVFNGGYSLSGVNVAFLLFLSLTGAITISPNDYWTLLALIFNPYSDTTLVQSLIPAMEALNFYSGLISTFLIFTVIRLALSGVADIIGDFNILLGIQKGCLAMSLVGLGGLFTIQSWSVNVGTYLTLVQTFTVTAIFLVPIVFIAFYRRKSLSGYRENRSNQLNSLNKNLSNLEERIKKLQNDASRTPKQTEELVAGYQKRREYVLQINQIKNRKYELPEEIPVKELAFISIPLAIIFFVTPLFHTFAYGIGMNGAQFTSWSYIPEIQKKIDITQWAADNDRVMQSTIEDFTSQGNYNNSFDPSDLVSVRQWDSVHSEKKMRNQIGVNWMKLADSDIVYWQGSEYWVAPLTINPEGVEFDFISRSFLFTHAEGLVAINAFTGLILDDASFLSTFGVASDEPLYYNDGYDPYLEVYVNYPEFQETGTYSYTGEPDYTLAGFESILWFLSKGQLSYLGQTIDMLLQREVRQRVQTMLLQGLTTEISYAQSDVYPMFSPTGDLYFSVPIYTNYPLTSGYTDYPYYRYMGLAHVNVSNGTIALYKNPIADQNSTFLESTYYTYYDWKDMPTWIQEQHRYPEDLWENQLSIDFFHHVDSAELWRNQEDVFHIPDGTDVNFLIMDINNTERFIGAQIVEFNRAQGANLAGIYLVGGSNDNFGEVTFYRAGGTGTNSLLGPTAAQQALTSDTAVAQFLQLLGTHQIGNIYLYQIRGRLLYVIPIYKDIGGAGATITKLSGVGLVEATTGENVSLGVDVIEAYINLFGIGNVTTSETDVTLGTLEFNPSPMLNGSVADLPIVINNDDDVFHNVSINIATFTPNINMSWYGSPITPTVYGSNNTFSFGTWELGPGDYFGTNIQVTGILDTGTVLQQYLLIVQLIVDDEIVFTTQAFLIVNSS